MGEMKVKATRVHAVTPEDNEHVQERDIWLSNLDLVFPLKYSNAVYFYPRKDDTGNEDFFNIQMMKNALAKALVPFYPYAGRLRTDENDGRLKIACNGGGVILVEATCEYALDDIQDFTPSDDLARFVPRLNDHLLPGAEVAEPTDLFSMPLFMAQPTQMIGKKLCCCCCCSERCGGVCLGVASQHQAADGAAWINFTNTWADITRGMTFAEMKRAPPIIERSILKARDSPFHSFKHPEYKHSRPSLPISEPPTDISVEVFQFTKVDIDRLKSGTKMSTYKALAGHVWRNACIARDLHPNQMTSLEILVDGRNRLNPPLQPGYFGNAIFLALPMTTCDKLVSNPLSYASEVIHRALVKMNDEYLRSSIDFLELHPFKKSGNLYRSPNLKLNTWAGIPFYDADFGWGKPIYVGPSRIGFEGSGYVLPHPHPHDGSVSLAFALQSAHMKKFKTLMYEF